MAVPWWLGFPILAAFLGCGIGSGVFLVRYFDVESWLKGFGSERPSEVLVLCIRMLLFSVGFSLGTLPFEFLRLLV